MKITFTAVCNWLERGAAYVEIISVTLPFKWILATLELTTIATGSGYEIFTIVECILQLIYAIMI